MTKKKAAELKCIQKELKEIQVKLEEYSFARMAIEMGYSSPNVVQYWFKQKKIPSSALKRVRSFLKKAS